MIWQTTRDIRANRWRVASLAILAGGLTILAAFTFPQLSRLTPVSRKVTTYHLLEQFCLPRTKADLQCLQQCAGDGRDIEQYKQNACVKLPEEHPTPADQQRVESELYDRSPCADRCRTNWKTHTLWCTKSLDKANLDAVEACIYEGASKALFDWKETRCRQQCPQSRPDEPDYLTANDSCMVVCLLARLVEKPTAEMLQKLARQTHDWSDADIAARLRAQAEPPVPADFDDVRRDCRLAVVRATPDQPLEVKQVQEKAFAACVRARLTP